MATRSLIIVKGDKKFICSYCHWNGPNNKETLEKFYNTDALAKELISFGDISELGPKLHPTGKHTFEEPEKDVCIFYKRDRGDKLDPQVTGTMKKILDKYIDAGIEYVYVWDGSMWHSYEGFFSATNAAPRLK